MQYECARTDCRIKERNNKIKCEENEKEIEIETQQVPKCENHPMEYCAWFIVNVLNIDHLLSDELKRTIGGPELHNPTYILCFYYYYYQYYICSRLQLDSTSLPSLLSHSPIGEVLQRLFPFYIAFKSIFNITRTYTKNLILGYGNSTRSDEKKQQQRKRILKDTTLT